MLKTHYYGGIRKHQWVVRPLALHGTVILASGERIDMCVGEADDDPVFAVPDLLPHLSHNIQNAKKMDEAIPGEKLNVLIGGLPIGAMKDKERIKFGVLKLLNEKFGLVEEDFVSSELEVVPPDRRVTWVSTEHSSADTATMTARVLTRR